MSYFFYITCVYFHVSSFHLMRSPCSEYSMQLNASRIKVLQAQDDLVNSMKESASKELLRVSKNSDAYQKLLKDLIVQVPGSQLIYTCK